MNFQEFGPPNTATPEGGSWGHGEEPALFRRLGTVGP
jgi:hypothetical protein